MLRHKILTSADGMCGAFAIIVTSAVIYSLGLVPRDYGQRDACTARIELLQTLIAARYAQCGEASHAH